MRPGLGIRLFCDSNPSLLDVLDNIRDRARLDLQADSELSICAENWRSNRRMMCGE
jgi:hypothetical protein